jgi:hypothetical protein
LSFLLFPEEFSNKFVLNYTLNQQWKTIKK